MSLTRIEAEALEGKGVIGLPSIPGLEALDMQKKFDELVTDVVVPKFNALSDELSSNQGADKIGSADGTTVQEVLTELCESKAQADNVLAMDNESPYTPTADYHPATKKYVDDVQIAAGAGDMVKSIYDTNNDGIVDQAETAQDALLLNGKGLGYFGQAPVRLSLTIGTSWSGSSAPYTQTVAAAGVLESDCPHIAPVYSSTLATALKQKEAWRCVRSASCAADSLIFTCDEEKPQVQIPIQVEILR